MLPLPTIGTPRTKSIFFFFLLLLFSQVSLSFSGEATVMFKLFAAISPAPSGWSISKHPCTWTNVECDNSTNLVSINLDSQSISGELPSELTQLASLRRFSVQNNFLSGRLPSFANMSSLEELYLDSNEFSSIPQDFLFGLPNLQTFSISDNGKLSPWQISSYLAESTSLGSFFASNASITGVIPNFFDSFPNLQKLRLSYNNLTGSLPGSFGSSEIQNLWLNNQQLGLSGTIDVLSSMTRLSQVWLQANAFTGPIPDLSKCENLQVLDVSNNNLSGPIPSFPPAVKISIDGNLFLGKNVSSSDPESGGSPDTVLNSEAPSNSNGYTYSLTVGLATKTIILFFAIFVLKSLIVLVCYKCHAWRKALFVKDGRMSNNQTGEEKLPAKKTGIEAIPIQVLEKATNFFSQENVLGSGGYGVVYMGELDDETKIAVKRMKDGGTLTKRMNEFQAEISFLNNVRHRNLVTLLGYCINENERLLVYEYMPQGTLAHHLFDWQKQGFGPLTWNQRVTIALDVARGIEYLHNLARQSFIHRDIKSSNVLLNNDMRAKVADFGLVKMTLDGKSSVHTRVAGTFGYLAPEYATTGRVTKKVDVYAFGVVLMELITGKKAVDETLANEMCHLVTWFRKIIRKRNNLGNAIDPTLDHDEQIFESISKVAELAIHCTANKSFGRPDMGHVVNVLCPYVQQWRPLRPEEINEKCGGLDIHMSLPLVFDYSSTQNLSFIDTQLYRHRPRRSAQF